MTRRDTFSAFASALLLAGCNKSTPQPENRSPSPAPISTSSELQLDYAILLEQGSVPTPVAGDHHFRGGDRFRIQLRPQFSAFLYLANRSAGDQDYSFLFPHARIPATNPLEANQTVTLPSEEWYTLDNRPGLENLVLLAATRPLPDFAVAQPIPRDDFEARIAVLERDHRPASSRRIEDHDWVRLFASFNEGTVLVVRLPLDHS